MISIKNLKVFNCDTSESFHWSKLPKLKCKMETESLIFPYSYVDLTYTDLRHADLSFANLTSAHLDHANLLYANLKGADLGFASLRFANLRYADLSNTDLRSVDLRYADLQGADLSCADLSDTDLRHTKLRSASLAPIDGSRVVVKDFMTVIGLGSENRQTLIFKTNIGIVLKCGCFYGTEKEFKKEVKETHAGTNYEKEYMEMLKLAKIRFGRKDK